MTMNSELSNIILSIREIPVDDRLTDDAVVALTEIHLSLMTALAAGMPGDECSSAGFHRGALEQLFDICRRRTAANQSLARCSRLTPAMYNILYMPDTSFNPRRHDACLNRSFGMADRWRKMSRIARPMDEKARITEYGILQSLLNAFSCSDDEDRDADEDFIYLRRRVAEWAAQMNGDGSWSGIFDYEAMRRADIMAGYSNCGCDARFDAQVGKSLRFYFDRIAGNQFVDSHTLFHLYWAMMRGVCYPDARMVGAIADCAAAMAGSYRRGSDEWLWAAAVLADRRCCQANDRLKTIALAHSA